MGNSVGRRMMQAMALTTMLMVVTMDAGQSQDYPRARPILTSSTTVTGETIRYPTDGAAEVTAAIVTIAPGQSTGLHRHGVPLFAYMLAGELTVDYGAKGIRDYKVGDGFLEAMDAAHDGRNTGTTPVSILVVYMGAQGAPQVLPPQ
jgi:quercetin dioxygenase-like cupin family protein